MKLSSSVHSAKKLRLSSGALALFAMQLLAHLSWIPLLIYGKPIHFLIVGIVYFFTGSFGMSMSYHRRLSHGSWQPVAWFRYAGVLFAAIGLTGGPISWVAIHREHHAKTDQAQDPHSPLFQSFWRIQFLSMFMPPKLRMAKDLLKDPYLKWIQRRYIWINMAYALVLLVTLGPFAVVYMHLAPAALLWNAGSLINNLGHTHGYRNFLTADHSRNNPFLGIFMWGEGWHNNHHRYPRRSNFSEKWYELDISYFFIRLFRSPRKISPKK